MALCFIITPSYTSICWCILVPAETIKSFAIYLIQVGLFSLVTTFRKITGELRFKAGLNLYIIADTEQKTGCERSTLRLMVSTFVKGDGWETCDILRSALSHKVYFHSSQLTKTKTIPKLLWPFLIVNWRIPGLIWRETPYFVQNNTTFILPGDTRRGY